MSGFDFDDDPKWKPGVDHDDETLISDAGLAVISMAAIVALTISLIGAAPAWWSAATAFAGGLALGKLHERTWW